MALDVCPESTAPGRSWIRSWHPQPGGPGAAAKHTAITGSTSSAIIQGGTYTDLRRESAEQITSLDFPGYAIGGLSLGEPKAMMWEIVGATIPYLPADRPGT